MNNLIVFVMLSIASLSLQAAELHTYFSAAFMDVKQTEAKLKGQGFEILGKAQVNASAAHTVIIFTHPLMAKSASKKDRAFAGVMRVLVNSKKKELRLTNPQYFLRAFLQKEFDAAVAKGVEDKMKAAFGALTGTKNKLEAGDLADYHFMFGMPYYADMDEVAEGKKADLMAKFEKNAGKNIVFKKDFGASTLYAVTLAGEIEGFPAKLKVEYNSQVLPYMVIIQEGQAKILAAKYYLAVSLLLSMGEFMTISDMPGKIENAVEKLFK
jgi:hypothetical protein